MIRSLAGWYMLVTIFGIVEKICSIEQRSNDLN